VVPEDGFHDKANRSLSFACTREDMRLIRVRAFDVATFVAHGAAQVGIVGSDVVEEFDYADLLITLIFTRRLISILVTAACLSRCLFKPLTRRDQALATCASRPNIPISRLSIWFQPARRSSKMGWLKPTALLTLPRA